MKESGMFKRICTGMMTFVLLYAVCVNLASAQGLSDETIRTVNETNNNVFCNVKRVGVSVAIDTNVTDNPAILEEELKTFVELKLRQSAITIRDKEDKYQLGDNTLLVSISLLCDEVDKRCATNVQMTLRQSVSLQNGYVMSACVWNSISHTGLIDESRTGDIIKEQVEEQLVPFCNEYLKANPKN